MGSSDLVSVLVVAGYAKSQGRTAVNFSSTDLVCCRTLQGHTGKVSHCYSNFNTYTTFLLFLASFPLVDRLNIPLRPLPFELYHQIYWASSEKNWEFSHNILRHRKGHFEFWHLMGVLIGLKAIWRRNTRSKSIYSHSSAEIARVIASFCRS